MTIQSRIPMVRHVIRCLRKHMDSPQLARLKPVALYSVPGMQHTRQIPPRGIEPSYLLTHELICRTGPHYNSELYTPQRNLSRKKVPSRFYAERILAWYRTMHATSCRGSSITRASARLAPIPRILSALWIRAPPASEIIRPNKTKHGNQTYVSDETRTSSEFYLFRYSDIAMTLKKLKHLAEFPATIRITHILE